LTWEGKEGGGEREQRNRWGTEGRMKQKGKRSPWKELSGERERARRSPKKRERKRLPGYTKKREIAQKVKGPGGEGEKHLIHFKSFEMLFQKRRNG